MQRWENPVMIDNVTFYSPTILVGTLPNIHPPSAGHGCSPSAIRRPRLSSPLENLCLASEGIPACVLRRLSSLNGSAQFIFVGDRALATDFALLTMPVVMTDDVSMLPKGTPRRA